MRHYTTFTVLFLLAAASLVVPTYAEEGDDSAKYYACNSNDDCIVTKNRCGQPLAVSKALFDPNDTDHEHTSLTKESNCVGSAAPAKGAWCNESHCELFYEATN